MLSVTKRIFVTVFTYEYTEIKNSSCEIKKKGFKP